MPQDAVNVKMIVQYDGSGFHGFQKQKGAVRTVQSELESALEELTGRAVEIKGAGRTDTGVHALGQVVSFRCGGPVPADRLAEALATRLPRDINTRTSEAVPGDFSARFSAVGKTYQYVFYPARRPVPFLRNTALNIPRGFDPALARQAADLFVGTHDFSGFQNSSDTPRDPVKTMHGCEVVEEGGFTIFRVTGSGFLYRMVRNMAGTLLEAGLGKISADRVAAALDSGDRALAGPTLPPCGLYLMRVYYDPENIPV